MASAIVDIADAVVTALNGASFGVSFTATRAYVLAEDLRNIIDPEVTVIPGILTVTAFDLTPRLAFDAEVDVWIRQRMAPTTSLVDPLMELVDEIVTMFLSRPLAGTRARCIGFEARPSFDPATLDTMRLFITPLRLKFRLTRP